MPHDARSSRMEGALQKSPTIARLSRIALLLFDRARRKVLNKNNLRARLESRADRWESKVQVHVRGTHVGISAPRGSQSLGNLCTWPILSRSPSYPILPYLTLS